MPKADDERLFAFLGANVGDHLAAATANVLGRTPRHVEQAVFSNTLSAESVQAAAPLVQQQWQVLLGALAPALQQLIDEDERAGRKTGHRIRIGLYSYHEPLVEESDVNPP